MMASHTYVKTESTEEFDFCCVVLLSTTIHLLVKVKMQNN